MTVPIESLLREISGEVRREALRSLMKHGDQVHLPDGTGPETTPLATLPDLGPHLDSPAAVYSAGLAPGGWAQYLAHQATLDCQAHSRNEGGDGTVTWWHILREEVFEASAEVDPAKLREELIQVAAVAMKWIEAIDRRAQP